MSVAPPPYGLFGVEIGNGNVLPITQQSLPPGTEVRSETSSGRVYPEFQAVVAQKSSASFSTLAIAAALDMVGLIGKDVSTLTGGFSMWAEKHASGGTRAGASSHRKHNVALGLIVPGTLSVEHQGDATLPYDVLILGDGAGNDPVVITKAQTLPTLTAGDIEKERFTLGKVTIGGILLEGVTSVEIDFGIEAVTVGADSTIHDTFVSIHTIAPVITIKGIDLEWLDSAKIPYQGKVATHTGDDATSIYLRKRAVGGTLVPLGTAEHIKFTADGLATIENALDVSGNDTGEVNLVMPLRFDGTNAPLIVNTAIAIT